MEAAEPPRRKTDKEKASPAISTLLLHVCWAWPLLLNDSQGDTTTAWPSDFSPSAQMCSAYNPVRKALIGCVCMFMCVTIALSWHSAFSPFACCGPVHVILQSLHLWTFNVTTKWNCQQLLDQEHPAYLLALVKVSYHAQKVLGVRNSRLLKSKPINAVM